MKLDIIDRLIWCLILIPYCFICKVDYSDIVDLILENWYHTHIDISMCAKILFWRKCRKIGVEKAIFEIAKAFEERNQIAAFEEFLEGNKKYKAMYDRIMLLR